MRGQKKEKVGSITPLPHSLSLSLPLFFEKIFIASSSSSSPRTDFFCRLFKVFHVDNVGEGGGKTNRFSGKEEEGSLGDTLLLRFHARIGVGERERESLKKSL